MSYSRQAKWDLLAQRLVYTMFAIFVGIAMVIMSHADGFPYAAFKIDKATVEGKVISFEGNNKNYILKYSFTGVSGNHHENTQFVDKKVWFYKEEGEPINITYFPSIPEISYASKLVPHATLSFGIMASGLTLTLLASLVAIVLIIALIKNRKEE